MKVGDLVQIRHNERHGLFIVINSEGFTDGWTRILSLRDGKMYCEMTRSLEVICESR
jgi:hypothetical protein